MKATLFDAFADAMLVFSLIAFSMLCFMNVGRDMPEGSRVKSAATALEKHFFGSKSRPPVTTCSYDPRER